MTLTLTQLLEIDAKLLVREEERGLMLARLLWKEAGYPSERRALCRALERILTVSQEEGIRYPAILLRRTKGSSAEPGRPRPRPRPRPRGILPATPAARSVAE